MKSTPVDLEEYRRVSAGRPYRSLVALEVVRRDPSELAAEVRCLLGRLPLRARRAQERFFNRWNWIGQQRAFWRRDCAEALDEIVVDAHLALARAGVEPGEEQLLHMFRLATVGLALTAARSAEVREAMELESDRVRPLAGRPTEPQA